MKFTTPQDPKRELLKERAAFLEGRIAQHEECMREWMPAEDIAADNEEARNYRAYEY